MKRKRDLLVTNILALLVLLAALLAGWPEAAAFGLAVLVIMDMLAILAERWPRRSPGLKQTTETLAEPGPGPSRGAEPGSEHSEPDA